MRTTFPFDFIYHLWCFVLCEIRRFVDFTRFRSLSLRFGLLPPKSVAWDEIRQTTKKNTQQHLRSGFNILPMKSNPKCKFQIPKTNRQITLISHLGDRMEEEKKTPTRNWLYKLLKSKEWARAHSDYHHHGWRIFKSQRDCNEEFLHFWCRLYFLQLKGTTTTNTTTRWKKAHTHSQRGVELELGEMKANLIRLFHFIYAFAFRDSK